MALSQEEINKIHEEEAERAKAQQMYAAKHPQTVVVKKKTGCVTWGCLVLLIIPLIGIIATAISVGIHGTAPQDTQQQQDQHQNTLQELGRVEILSSTIQFDSIGTPELVVKLKNNAGQAVDAVTLETQLLNNYDEPIGQWNVKAREPYRGILQERIEAGATYTARWNLAVYDLATKVESSSVVKVHYIDGSSYSL